MRRQYLPFSIKDITFRNMIQGMCLILLFITLCNVSFMHSQQKREKMEQITQKSQEVMHAWISDKGQSIERLESYLFTQFSDNEALAELSTETNPVKQFHNKKQLLDDLKMTVQLNGSAQSVFLYIPQGNDVLYLARYLEDQFTVTESTQIQKDVLHIIQTEYPNQNSLQWVVCNINGTTCLFWMIHIGENICGAWIDCNTYLQDCLNLATVADNISMQLVKDESIICKAERESSSKLTPSALLEVPSPHLRMTVVMHLFEDSFLSEEQIRFDYVWFVSTLLIIILIIVFTFQAFMYYPIRRLTQEVAALQKTEDMLPIHENYRTREIRSLSQYINQNMNKLKEMKINTYEAKLSEQQMAQEFLLMRHKTHFFINCMSVIHALAGDHNDTLIQKLSRALIKYLRKIDYEKQELVRLNDELSLIHSYIDIQKVRFGDSFRFVEEVPIDLFEAGIPPLILQTFVENAVEHGRIHQTDNIVRLSISFAELKGAYLRIDITDNGSGFSENLLKEFQNIHRPKHLSQGHGVGICNAIARLKHIYGDRAFICIENDPEGGAHIHMDIPITDQEEENVSGIVCR